jgi:phage regulator Rha-like protein
MPAQVFRNINSLSARLKFELSQMEYNMRKFSVDIPFETKPPRLKDLVNQYIMGDVWIRDTPFGPVTDSIILAQKFQLKHSNILRSINKCRNELSMNEHYKLQENLIESSYLAGPEGKGRSERKVDITEFGLALLLLYINSPKARQISAEILYRFFILKTYVGGLNERQIGAIKGYYLKQME